MRMNTARSSARQKDATRKRLIAVAYDDPMT
jgi:hypothetical protein